MKVTKLDHIGIAVKNMDEALAFYRDTLGLYPLLRTALLQSLLRREAKAFNM